MVLVPFCVIKTKDTYKGLHSLTRYKSSGELKKRTMTPYRLYKEEVYIKVAQIVVFFLITIPLIFQSNGQVNDSCCYLQRRTLSCNDDASYPERSQG